MNCSAQALSGVNASVHYHDVDDEQDTTFAMLSMWNAGLRAQAYYCTLGAAL